MAASIALRMAGAVGKLSPKCAPVYLDALRSNDGLFNEYGITTGMRQAHFLAQFMGETGGGTVLQESGNYTSVKRIMQIFGVGRHSAAVTEEEAAKLVRNPEALFERVYGLGNPRKAHELGNIKPGDGYTFRGIGPLQSTGRAAAKVWGDRCKTSFEDNALLMVDPRYVWLPPLFEWKQGRLNDYADRNDLTHIRRVINGGYNGLEDCRAWFDKLWPILKADGDNDDAWAAAIACPTTRTLQLMLNELGYSPTLTMDGKSGPKTVAAIKWFQTINNLKVDGIAGLVTVQTMKLRLAAFHIPAQDPDAA